MAKTRNPPQAVPFAQASKRWKLTRHGTFAASFDQVRVHEGDLSLGAKATGRQVLAAFGLTAPPRERTLFLVTGDLLVGGALDLDGGIHFSMGLAVLGTFKADVLRLDMTMLFVFGGAEVKGAIFFESNDGTLCIAGKTECPLVVTHAGDLNLSASGEVFDSRSEATLEEGDDGGGPGWPTPSVTMTPEEAAGRLVPALFKDGAFDSKAAFRRAVGGKPLLRDSPPGKPTAAKQPAGPASSKLEPVPVIDGRNIGCLVSDGTSVWGVAASSLFSLEGNQLTRTWRADPSGMCDGPGAALRFLAVTASGHLLGCGDGMGLAASKDGGTTWPAVSGSGCDRVAAFEGGVAGVTAGGELWRAPAVDGRWRKLSTGLSGVRWLAGIGGELWLAHGAGVARVVDDDVTPVSQLPAGTVVECIAATRHGVLLGGQGGMLLLTRDQGRSFMQTPSGVKGDCVAIAVKGDLVFVVGGRGKSGFLLRSRDGGASFEVVDGAIPAVMRAVVVAGSRVIMAGDGKLAYSLLLA